MKKLKRPSVGNVEKENERDETYEAKNPKIDLSRTKYCVKFFADKYGAENIISAVVHMDETTPHLHLNLVPITNGKLCSKDLYSPKKLSALQTELANTVGKKWGLKRGKIGSTARHIEAAEYTAKEIMTKAQAAADDTKRQAEQYLDDIVQSVESTADKPIPAKRKQAEEEIKTLRAQNAALQKSLDIKNKDTADLFEQLQRAERLGKGKNSAFRMVGDMMSAYPEEFDALLKKSRAAKFPSPPNNYKSRGKEGK